VIVNVGARGQEPTPATKLGADLATQFTRPRISGLEEPEKRMDRRRPPMSLSTCVGGVLHRPANLRCRRDWRNDRQIAFLSGTRRAYTLLFKVMERRGHHTGSTLRPRIMRTRQRWFAALEARVMPLLSEGARSTTADGQQFPLEKGRGCAPAMETSRILAKIVLRGHFPASARVENPFDSYGFMSLSRKRRRFASPGNKRLVGGVLTLR